MWTSRCIAARPGLLWELLVDHRRWPDWGSSVQSAEIDDSELRLGTTGTVRTVFGVALPFEITSFEPGKRWAWHVGGIPATDHVIEALGDRSCRVSFGVPFIAAPYLAVCRRALRRLDAIAVDETAQVQAGSGAIRRAS